MTVLDYANGRRRAHNREKPDTKSRILTTARIAGLLYLVVAICGGFAEAVRSRLIESGDATATARNILDNELLFRVSFAGDLVAFSADVALALVLYVLLRPVNATLALLAAFFRLAQGAVLGINLLNQFFALLLLSGDSYLGAFERAQLDALALLFLEAHRYGYLIGLVFFGLSNLFLGYLVLKSRFLPWILGVGLMTFVAFGYLADSYTSFVIEDKAEIISVILIAPAAIVELAFIAWLLIRGGHVHAEAMPGDALRNAT